VLRRSGVDKVETDPELGRMKVKVKRKVLYFYTDISQGLSGRYMNKPATASRIQ